MIQALYKSIICFPVFRTVPYNNSDHENMADIGGLERGYRMTFYSA